MTITPAAHVSDIVTAAPATIAVFQRHHIEFCCGGHVPLGEVCAHEGLDVNRLIDELTAATEAFDDAADWQAAPLPELVSHIQTTYHAALYEELPRLAAMLASPLERRAGDIDQGTGFDHGSQVSGGRANSV